ncbi:RidA family protein [Gallaecimonas mangrovi]|uniref:RidA family protein n=1 Tax=Gallaecimonas mangrovi TaxID=2291597 RepID=UPI000E2060B9|nr:RidA family protein [Gallaecimonas mangrovi]
MKKALLLGATLMLAAGTVSAAQVKRYPLPGGSTFPIASAVEVDGTVYQSGMVPAPKNPKAAKGSEAYWGDTQAQTLSVLTRIQASLKEKGLDMGDVVKMTAFLVGDPKHGGKLDFAGFMKSYTQFFGTKAQPNLPARSAVQVAALAGEGMLVEIEVIAVRPK